MMQLPTILLVEDNEDFYEATVRSLKKNHFVNPIHWCKSGQQALDYLNKQNTHASDDPAMKPALILLDLNMPGIDGREVLSRIKEDAGLKTIPVIILTTSIDPVDVEECYRLGASTYIQKPVSFDGLTEAIRTMQSYWFGIAILPAHEKVDEKSE